MTNHRKYAKRSERPDPQEKDQAGFFGKPGHASPTPPGGKNPGGSGSDSGPRRKHRDDRSDDPGATAPDERNPGSRDRKTK
jgi:hypothetical protein